MARVAPNVQPLGAFFFARGADARRKRAKRSRA
jgi:hypothetical protein